MAISVHLYGPSYVKALNGSSLTMSLHTSAYTPNRDSHSTTANLAGEITDSNYARATLTNLIKTYNATTHTWMLDADDVSFSASSITGVRYAVLESGVDLLGYLDFGVDVNGPISIQWDIGGIVIGPVS